MDFYFANCLTTVCVRTKQTIESIKMQELYMLNLHAAARAILLEDG
jgi:hypothetical protein